MHIRNAATSMQHHAARQVPAATLNDAVRSIVHAEDARGHDPQACYYQDAVSISGMPRSGISALSLKVGKGR